MPFDVHRDHLPPQALRIPARWRYRPLTAALWRMLMVDVASLRAVASDRSTDPLDMVAARFALSAIGGDMRAAKLIMDLIDGPVRSKAGRNNGAGPRSAGDDAARERTITGLAAACAPVLAGTPRG